MTAHQIFEETVFYGDAAENCGPLVRYLEVTAFAFAGDRGVRAVVSLGNALAAVGYGPKWR